VPTLNVRDSKVTLRFYCERFLTEHVRARVDDDLVVLIGVREAVAFPDLTQRPSALARHGDTLHIVARGESRQVCGVGS
jgi:hypothetical protein